MPAGAVLHRIGAPLSVEELDLQRPTAGEVRLLMRAAGICNSDLAMQDGKLLVRAPMVLGHQGVGRVVEVGPGVSDVAVGDHVVVLGSAQCGACPCCVAGEPHLCDQGRGMALTGALPDGTTRLQTSSNEGVHQMAGGGTFCEEIVVPRGLVVPIEGDVDPHVAALVGCAVLTGTGAAFHTADVQVGSSVAVLGCGPIGLCIIQAVRLLGAASIIAVDPIPERLELAARLGASAMIEPTADDPVATIKRLTAQRGVHVAFEAAGLQVTTDQALEMTRIGGQVILVGAAPPDVMIHVSAMLGMMATAKTIRGCYFGSTNAKRDVPTVLALQREGRLDIASLRTDAQPLAEINSAFEGLRTRQRICTVLEMS
jgi:Zn-dependent alcohol dehydrogenase